MIASKHEVIHQKIQLWTNKYENEFALRLADAANQSENWLAATDLTADYITVVAESDYLEDLRHGWDYALRHFIEKYKEFLHKKDATDISKENMKNIPSLSTYVSNTDINRFPIRIISFIKCHYCDLEFDNDNERKEHELKWHV